MGVARIFQRGGWSHRVMQRVLTKLSPEYCRLFAYKKAYKGGGSHALQDPPGYALAMLLLCESMPFTVVKCFIISLRRRLHSISRHDCKISKTVCIDKTKRVSEVFL